MFITHPYKLIHTNPNEVPKKSKKLKESNATIETNNETQPLNESQNPKHDILEKTELNNSSHDSTSQAKPTDSPTTSSSSNTSSSSSSDSDSEQIQNTFTYNPNFNYSHLVVFENQLDMPNHLLLTSHDFEEYILLNKYDSSKWKLVDVDNFMEGNTFFYDKSNLEQILNNTSEAVPKDEQIHKNKINFNTLDTKLNTFNRIMSVEEEINIFDKLEKLGKKVEKHKADMQKKILELERKKNEALIVELKEKQAVINKNKKGGEKQGLGLGLEVKEVSKSEESSEKINMGVDYNLDLAEYDRLNRLAQVKRMLLKEMDEVVDVNFNFNNNELTKYLQTEVQNDSQSNAKIKVIIQFKFKPENIKPVISKLSNNYKSKIVVDENKNDYTIFNVEEMNEYPLDNEIKNTRKLIENTEDQEHKNNTNELTIEDMQFIHDFTKKDLTSVLKSDSINKNYLDINRYLNQIENNIKVYKNFDKIFDIQFECTSTTNNITNELRQQSITNFKKSFINKSDIESLRLAYKSNGAICPLTGKHLTSKKDIKELKELFELKPIKPKSKEVQLKANYDPAKPDVFTLSYREKVPGATEEPIFENEYQERRAMFIATKLINHVRAYREGNTTKICD